MLHLIQKKHAEGLSTWPNSGMKMLVMASPHAFVDWLLSGDRFIFVKLELPSHIKKGQELTMLTKYIRAAMGKARYEILPDDGTFYGEIVGFDGVWANTDTLEACRDELEEVLEGWILLRVSLHLPLPVVDNIELPVGEVA